MLTIAANMKRAAELGQTVEVGGGFFGPAELLEAARHLEQRQMMLEALRDVPKWLGKAMEVGAFSRCCLPNAPRALNLRIAQILEIADR